MWNTYLRDNINKLLDRGHRVLTVAQFSALTGLEGTKGTVAPDEVYLEVDATNGKEWHLAFESGEVTYKWRKIGGPALFSEVTTSEATASTAFAALATAGPSVALPRSGDYKVRIGFSGGTGGTLQVERMSYDIGGTGASDNDAAKTLTSTGTAGEYSVGRPREKTGLGSVTLTAKYRQSAANSAPFAERWMEVDANRLRHDA